MRGNVVEVFSSVQGEGIYVGWRQIFVRLGGCNLKCGYCDTPVALHRVSRARLQAGAGSNAFETADNDLEAEVVVRAVNRLEPAWHHAVSFTGGEPLVQSDFLMEIIQGLRLPREKVLLETNGTLPQALARVLPYVGIISMDLKPVGATDKDLWDAHYDFLTLSRKATTYLKLVVTEDLADDDWQHVLTLAARFPEYPLVLQPVTPENEAKAPPGHRLLALQAQGLQKGISVRLIPQTHKQLGIL